jgi:sulfate adenylyltransferase subunit 1 (EFTu-like GTPase family)
MDTMRMGASGSKKAVSTSTSLGLRIKTVPNGFNSGRVYVLRACTEQQRADIIADLTRRADEERKRAEARSRFKMNQVNISVPDFDSFSL